MRNDTGETRNLGASGRATGGDDSLGVERIFDGDWQTMQRSKCFTARERIVGSAGGFQRTGFVDLANGVERSVDRTDAIEMKLGEFLGRNSFRTEQPQQFGGGFKQQRIGCGRNCVCGSERECKQTCNSSDRIFQKIPP